jgi:hypothetical protein
MKYLQNIDLFNICLSSVIFNDFWFNRGDIDYLQRVYHFLDSAKILPTTFRYSEFIVCQK